MTLFVFLFELYGMNEIRRILPEFRNDILLTEIHDLVCIILMKNLSYLTWFSVLHRRIIIYFMMRSGLQSLNDSCD